MKMRIDKEFDTIVLYFAALRTWPDQLTDSSGHNVQIQPSAKVIYTKYSKHWPYTVAHTIDCVCIEC